MKNLLKDCLKPSYWAMKRYLQTRAFKKALATYQSQPMKVVIGSSDIYQKGWIPTEVHFLNLLEETTWNKFFKLNQLEALFAEHVWEHLTLQQGIQAAANCYKYLQKGGRLRIAVPDGYHNNPQYIEHVKPGGIGPGADDHKVLYNYKTLSEIFQQNGFEVEVLEYFDENHKFHAVDWNDDYGHVRRSVRYDKQYFSRTFDYTSLIIDAVKM